MNPRKIPRLQTTVEQTFVGLDFEEDVQLIQVQGVVRHGARAPWGAYPCWDNYQAVWNCDVEILQRPIPRDGFDLGGGVMFKKVYGNGLISKTELGGSCMVGGLLDEGYEQQIENGRHWRDAYICEGAGCLFSNQSEALAATAEGTSTGRVYLHSDDEQRTVLSGQTLIMSFLTNTTGIIDGTRNTRRSRHGIEETEAPTMDATLSSANETSIGESGLNATSRPLSLPSDAGDDVTAGALTPNCSATTEYMSTPSPVSALSWHTGDLSWDLLYENTDECPRIKELQFAAKMSPGYIELVSGPQAMALTVEITRIFGTLQHDLGHIFDCTLTAVCTDQPLPDNASKELVDSIVKTYTQNSIYVQTYNDSRVGKLASAPLVASIRRNMIDATLGKSPLEFAIFSGHDDTVLPLLSVLAIDSWDQTWPPYAAAATFELIKVKEDYYVRLVYDGKVVGMTGECDNKDLCPIDDFAKLAAYSIDPEVDNCTAEHPHSSAPPTSQPPPALTYPPTSTSASGMGDTAGTPTPPPPPPPREPATDTQWLAHFVFAALAVGTVSAAIYFSRRTAYDTLSPEPEPESDYNGVNGYQNSGSGREYGGWQRDLTGFQLPQRNNGRQQLDDGVIDF